MVDLLYIGFGLLLGYIVLKILSKAMMFAGIIILAYAFIMLVMKMTGG